MQRTRFAKRRAGYKRVLRQYVSLGYVDAHIKLAESIGPRLHRVTLCETPAEVDRVPKTAHYVRTFGGCLDLRESAKIWDRLFPTLAESVPAVDMAPIHAEFERQLEAAVPLVDQAELDFVIHSDVLGLREHATAPAQYEADVQLAERLAAEIIDGADRGYAPKARKAAGLSRTGDTRFKRDVLVHYWKWLQLRSVEETGRTLTLPQILAQARKESA